MTLKEGVDSEAPGAEGGYWLEEQVHPVSGEMPGFIPGEPP